MRLSSRRLSFFVISDKLIITVKIISLHSLIDNGQRNGEITETVRNPDLSGAKERTILQLLKTSSYAPVAI